jgi:PAS domain S-box-containing protein
VRLRSKIALLVFLTIVVLGGLVAVTATVVMTSSLREEIRQKGLSNALQSTTRFARALVDEDPETISRSLTGLLGLVPESHFAYLIGMDGEVAGHTFGGGFPRELLGANVVPPGDPWRIVSLDLGRDRIMDIGCRVIVGGRAELHLGMSERAIFERSLGLLAVITLISVAAVLGGMTVAVVLANRYTRPLDELARHAAAFGETGRIPDLPVASDDEVGRLTAAFNTMARNLAETLAAVEHSERRYRTLVETALEGVISIDRDGIILFANKRLSEMVGWARDEVVGQSVLSFLPADQRDLFAAILARRGEGTPGRYELTVLHRSGSLVDVLVSASPLFDEAGRLIGSFGLLTDITEIKRTEESLRQAHADLEARCEELKKIDAIKDGLIRDVSHELKTPVAKHAMQMEILRSILTEHNLLDQAGMSLDVIDRSISRQEHVIRNILNLARLESGGRRYRREEVRLDELLGAVLDDYQDAIRSYGVSVSHELAPLAVASDREMLWHVLSNLVNNALKFRRTAGLPRLDISLREAGGRAAITVADNGIGMEATEREHAFERFYQATPTSEGSGVGLTICRKIVEDLGGEIRIESPGRDRGTTVTVTLPP